MGDEIGEPDLVLVVGKIEEDARHTSYSIEANREFWSDPGCQTLCSKLGTLVIMGSERSGTDELLLALEGPHNTRAGNTDPEDRTEAVRELGKYLWDLLPCEFQHYYWKHLHGKELSILVLTDDLRFPWELVWPHRDSQAEEWHHIFGVAFSMARWPREYEPLPGSIASTGEFLIVIPGDDCADAEIDYLTTHYGATIIDPQTFEEIKSNIARTPVRVLHIRAHGAFETNGHSIQLDGAELFDRKQVPDLMGENLVASLVFLNVCEAALRVEGRQQPVQVAGWGGAFAKAGCSAIISPYWEVSPGVAASVVRWFYDHLRDGATVGEGMRAVRRSFATVDAGTPAAPEGDAGCYGSCGFASTCLGYTVIGHPNARIASFGAGRTDLRSYLRHRLPLRLPTPWEPLRG